MNAIFLGKCHSTRIQRVGFAQPFLCMPLVKGMKVCFDYSPFNAKTGRDGWFVYRCQMPQQEQVSKVK